MLRLTAALFVACIVLLAGCDSAGTEPDPPAQTNQAPTASAAVTATEVEAGETVQLDGSGSTDPDGDALTFTWTLDRPDGSEAELLDADDPAPTFIADVPGDYTATLSVSDGQADDSDEVSVTANPCSPQVIDSDIQTDTTFPDVCADDDAFDYIIEGTIDVTAAATFMQESSGASFLVGVMPNGGIRVRSEGQLIQIAADNQSFIVFTGAVPGEPWRGILYEGNDQPQTIRALFFGAGSEPWAGFDVAAGVSIDNDVSVEVFGFHSAAKGAFAVAVNPRGELLGVGTLEGDGFGDGLDVYIPDKQIGFLRRLRFDDRQRIFVYATATGIRDNTVIVSQYEDLTRAPATYFMDGIFEVNAELRIGTANAFRFTQDSGMRINDGGRLLAEGTDLFPIRMSSRREEEEDWRGILFRSSDRMSELDYVSMRKVGSEAWSSDVERAAIVIDNDARVSLTNVSVEESQDYALYMNPRALLTEFDDVTLDTSPFGAFIPDRQMGALSDFGGTARVYATIGIAEELVIPNAYSDGEGTRADYSMVGDFEVNAPVRITEPGVVLEFEEDSSVRVNDGGSLFVDGGSTNPVIFRGADPTPGFWQGILFRADDLASNLSNLIIRHGGREAWSLIDDPANISVQNSRLTLTNSEITDSAGWGVVLDGDDRVVFNAENNTYEGNALGAVGADE